MFMCPRRDSELHSVMRSDSFTTADTRPSHIRRKKTITDDGNGFELDGSLAFGLHGDKNISAPLGERGG